MNKDEMCRVLGRESFLEEKCRFLGRFRLSEGKCHALGRKPVFRQRVRIDCIKLFVSQLPTTVKIPVVGVDRRRSLKKVKSVSKK